MQLAWVTGSLLCLLRAVEAGGFADLQIADCTTLRSRRRPHVGGSSHSADLRCCESAEFCPGSGGSPPWLCVAGGLFTKWTAPAFFYLTAIPFLAVQGRLSLLWRAPHLVAAALVAALALGWLALAAHTASWPVLIDTIRREALLRLSPAHHPRPYPWDELLTFPLSFLAASLGWSICALFALRRPSPDCGTSARAASCSCARHGWGEPAVLDAGPRTSPAPPAAGPARPRRPRRPGVDRLADGAAGAGPSRASSPGRLLVGLLAAWLLVKLVFVASAPARHAHGSPGPAGSCSPAWCRRARCCTCSGSRTRD